MFYLRQNSASQQTILAFVGLAFFCTVFAAGSDAIGNRESKTENSTIVSNSVTIPAGVYVPLQRTLNDAPQISVATFLLDECPVTNAEFLAFVAANPKWRRSQVSRL